MGIGLSVGLAHWLQADSPSITNNLRPRELALLNYLLFLMIAVIVPAHNEEAYIEACLISIAKAAKCPHLPDEQVCIVVILDNCSDRTGPIAAAFGVQILECQARNVGVARALGAHWALAAGARWLAFTDADSEVAPDWLSRQLCLNVDAVCGTVQVRDWTLHGEEVQRKFEAVYEDREGHRHVHGANLGLTADAYQTCGGFEPLATGEDVALVRRLEEGGLSIAWTAATRVTTSARLQFRAPAGFGAALLAHHSGMSNSSKVVPTAT